MPDVSSTAPAHVDRWIVFDVRKNSLVAGVLPAADGSPEVIRLENTDRAVRRFLGRLCDPERLAVAYEAGPCGYELFRLLSGMGVACDVIAPSLVPVRAGDRIKTDRRDAKRLVRLYRAGELSFVEPPSPAQEGLRDLVRARDDLRRARTAARAISWPSSSCATAASTAKARRLGPSNTRRGSDASASTIRSPIARCATCAHVLAQP